MNILATVNLSASLLLAISSNAMACDNKSCEKAYLASTTQYIANHSRQAKTAKTEREAYASNRERRDFAVVYHIQRTRYFATK
jgi:hypothetical protein